jgi:hypothetical protein
LKLFSAREAGVSVIIEWVPGHLDLVGNMQADELARDGYFGVSKGTRVGEISVPCVASDLNAVLWAMTLSDWDTEWCGEVNGHDLFTLHPSVGRPLDLDLLPRRDAALLSRLRTGHTLLPGHAFDLGIRSSSVCGCGVQWVTVAHFLLDCPLYVVDREALRKRVGVELSLPALLGVRPHAGVMAPRALKAVLRFCRDVGKVDGI